MDGPFDIIVVGGGTAGVVAAIQCGRAGMRTLLVEKNGLPGGTMTAAGIAFPGLFFVWGHQIIAGIGWDHRSRRGKRTAPARFFQLERHGQVLAVSGAAQSGCLQCSLR